MTDIIDTTPAPAAGSCQCCACKPCTCIACECCGCSDESGHGGCSCD